MVFWLLIRRYSGLIGLILIANSAIAADINVVWLHSDADKFYEKIESYTGYTLVENKRPHRALLAAFKETKTRARASGVRLKLKTLKIDTGTQLAETINGKILQNDLVILDLPLPMTIKVAQMLRSRPVVLINARHRTEILRSEYCQSNLFHTIPSERMYADALSQWIKAEGWTHILAVTGTTDEDKSKLAAFTSSAERLNLDIKAVRTFSTSNNPEFRQQNNIKFLTGNLDYDLVVVFDSDKDFSRSIPYQTRLPRPVVGDQGLIPKSWHHAAERFGAPQLNQRFNRASILNHVEDDQHPRPMTDEDFAAWAAVKFLANNLPKKKTESIDLLKIFRAYRTSTVDLYKGMKGSFRPWNNQLRQPLFLVTENKVVEIAPIKGYLHAVNYADTLGVDQPESNCKFE